MKLTSFFAPLTVLILPALSFGYTVTYDQYFDTGSNSLNNVACSDGSNGLETRYGWTTISQVPTFPYLGGAYAIAGWNSASCGTCWNLTYTPVGAASITVTVTAIDTASNGFNIALEAMNTLTDGQAEQLGQVTVTSTQVDASLCGL